MKVIITKKHIDTSDGGLYLGFNFRNPFDCPAFRAIKEQYPNFQIQSVGLDYIRMKNGQKLYFQPAGSAYLAINFNPNIWGFSVVPKLVSGEISEFVLVIQEEKSDVFISAMSYLKEGVPVENLMANIF